MCLSCTTKEQVKQVSSSQSLVTTSIQIQHVLVESLVVVWKTFDMVIQKSLVCTEPLVILYFEI